MWVLFKAYPLVLHPARPQVNQSSMDPNFYTWSLRWWPYAIGHGLNPLHSTEIGAPAGYGLAWVTTIPPLALLLTPLTETAGPVVSFNLLVVVLLPASAWGAFVLCRRLTGRFWPALVGGAVYGFSSFEVNHSEAGQLNLVAVVLLPLMAYLVVLWRDGKIGPRALVGLLALAMVAQFYLFLEFFADMTAVWTVALLLGYALAGRPGRPVVAHLSRLVGLAYLLAIVFIAPYLGYALTHVPKGFARSPALYDLDLASLVIPGPGRAFGLSWLAHLAARPPIVSAGGYVGIPLLAIVVALAVFTWSRKITRFLCFMLVFIILVALGPVMNLDGRRVTGLPWARLWYLPIVRSALPARFMIFAFLVLAVMTALWLAGPSKRLWARWLLVPLAIAAVAANAPAIDQPSLPGSPAFIATGEYRDYLAPDSTVVIVSTRGNAGLLWQAETDFYPRLAGGFINTAITPGTDLPAPVAALAHATPRKIRLFRSFIRRARVAAILVEAATAPGWAGIFSKLGLHGTTIGGVILYKTIGDLTAHDVALRSRIAGR